MTRPASRFERTIGPYANARITRRGVLVGLALTGLAVAVIDVVVVTKTRGPLGGVAVGAALIALFAVYWYFWWSLTGATYRWLAAKDWSDARQTLAWFGVFWGVVIATIAAMGVLIELGD